MAGAGLVFTAGQGERTLRTIIDQRPEQLKMDFALWTRAAVGLLIAQQHGVKLPVRTVGNYPTRWGLTPQKPIQRVYAQRPECLQGRRANPPPVGDEARGSRLPCGSLDGAESERPASREAN
jgi:hypothetical protein